MSLLSSVQVEHYSASAMARDKSIILNFTAVSFHSCLPGKTKYSLPKRAGNPSRHFHKQVRAGGRRNVVFNYFITYETKFDPSKRALMECDDVIALTGFDFKYYDLSTTVTQHLRNALTFTTYVSKTKNRRRNFRACCLLHSRFSLLSFSFTIFCTNFFIFGAVFFILRNNSEKQSDG